MLPEVALVPRPLSVVVIPSSAPRGCVTDWERPASRVTSTQAFPVRAVDIRSVSNVQEGVVCAKGGIEIEWVQPIASLAVG